MSDNHIQTIQRLYQAFGEGDVETIVGFLADDVDWASEADSTVAPWHGVHKGRDEVPHFFQAIGESSEVTEFTPLAFGSNDTDVFTVVRYGVTARATGKSGTMDLHHWFRFDAGGKISYYRGTEDTDLTRQLFTP